MAEIFTQVEEAAPGQANEYSKFPVRPRGSRGPDICFGNRLCARPRITSRSMLVTTKQRPLLITCSAACSRSNVRREKSSQGELKRTPLTHFLGVLCDRRYWCLPHRAAPRRDEQAGDTGQKNAGSAFQRLIDY